MLLQRINWLVALGVLATGCTIGGDDDPTGPGPGPGPAPGDGGVIENPPVTPPRPSPGKYVRGSLKPVYELLNENEFPRFIEFNLGPIVRNDFVSLEGNFTSAAQKMDEISAQIEAERGPGSPAVRIVGTLDQDRALAIPFRGNPADVKVFTFNGQREAYVPLGGDVMTPGNEVVAVNLNNAQPSIIRTLDVGIRPLRVVFHPAGLVFVCNQYSNYISIIDVARHEILKNPQGENIEIKTEFYCSDLVVAPRNVQVNDPDEQDLYVANSWRGSVLKYTVNIVRAGVGDRISDVTVTETTPTGTEITGVGANPFRITLGQDKKTLFVANSRGGELARVDLANRGVRKVTFNALAIDVAQANDVLIIPTTTKDRGYPARNDTLPQPMSGTKKIINGTEAHPGALLDETKSYNFEDLRNGILTIDPFLQQVPQYFTDDISPEVNFDPATKIMEGSLPQAVILNGARTRAYMAMSGSDTVQRFDVVANGLRLQNSGAALFETGHRPYALALDEAANELFVVNWGGETLQVFDSNTAQLKSTLDLGYAFINQGVAYPATTIERGEFLYYNTEWSNNGRKSCAQCHFDELLLDGLPYGNGATAATMPHKVPANFNLLQTNSYFWNGSFGNGSYASLASDAQARSNCELILFGQIDGIGSGVNARFGDPNNNKYSLGATDLQCRAVLGAGVLPENFDAIVGLIDDTKELREDLIGDLTQAQIGFRLGFRQTSRAIDTYSVSEMRLPANPLSYLLDRDELDSDTKAKIAQGRDVFNTANCGSCHQPLNSRHPFTDGLNHGTGATWVNRFVERYGQDRRLLAIIPGGIPQNMTFGRVNSVQDKEINIHTDLDNFRPFCFDATKCLVFDDPLVSVGNQVAETERLEAIVKVNLANVDRGFVPGNPTGQPMANTPSLRGIWFHTNFLRHGLAKTLNETILKPGHSALAPGEKGFAIDALGNTNVHGITDNLSKEQVDALYLYLTTIE